MREIEICVSLLLWSVIAWSNRVYSHPQHVEKVVADTIRAGRNGLRRQNSLNQMPTAPGNPLEEMEGMLYDYLKMDEKECLLYIFCSQAGNITHQDLKKENMAGALKALRFILGNIPAISESVGYDVNDKLPAIKAFAAAGFMGAANKNKNICRQKYPGCPTDPKIFTVYLLRFMTLQEISQFAESSTSRRNLEQSVTVPASVNDATPEHQDNISVIGLPRNLGFQRREGNGRAHYGNDNSQRHPRPNIDNELQFFTQDQYL